MIKFDLNKQRHNIQIAFSDVPRPKDIDAWNNGQHEDHPFIAFVETYKSWQDISEEEFDRAPGQVGEIFLNRLTPEGYAYYTPLLLTRALSIKPSAFTSNELLYSFSPPECREIIEPASDAQKLEFLKKMELFTSPQKTAIADVFDFMSFSQMDWNARQAFEGYWHQFATRQPEIWEPWIK